MSYFDKFPLLVYDAKGQGNYKLVTDILRRVKLRTAIQDGAVLFDKYDVKLSLIHI